MPFVCIWIALYEMKSNSYSLQVQSASFKFLALSLGDRIDGDIFGRFPGRNAIIDPRFSLQMTQDAFLSNFGFSYNLLHTSDL